MYSFPRSLLLPEEFVQPAQAALCYCLAGLRTPTLSAGHPPSPARHFFHRLLRWCCTSLGGCFQHSRNCTLSRTPNSLLFPSALLALNCVYLCVRQGYVPLFLRLIQSVGLGKATETRLAASFPGLDFGPHLVHCLLIGPSKCSLWKLSSLCKALRKVIWREKNESSLASHLCK